MKKNKIALSKVEDIIDMHYKNKNKIMFICDEDLALYICDYLEEVYGIEDIESQLFEDDIDEFYVSIIFDDEESVLYCESARGNNG